VCNFLVLTHKELDTSPGDVQLPQSSVVQARCDFTISFVEHPCVTSDMSLLVSKQ
jgi:hypothetical protein